MPHVLTMILEQPSSTSSLMSADPNLAISFVLTRLDTSFYGTDVSKYAYAPLFWISVTTLHFIFCVLMYFIGTCYFSELFTLYALLDWLDRYMFITLVCINVDYNYVPRDLPTGSIKRLYKSYGYFNLTHFFHGLTQYERSHVLSYL